MTIYHSYFDFSDDEEEEDGLPFRSRAYSPTSEPGEPLDSDSDDPSPAGSEDGDPDAWILGGESAPSDASRSSGGSSPEPEDPFSDLSELPPAFDEHPLIRNGYIRIFIDAAFNHATHESVKQQLSLLFHTLSEIERTSALGFPGLDTMARSLPTLERRLGVSSDQFIRKYFVCNQCWHRHEWDDLYHLTTPECTQEFCGGTIYTTKPNSRGREVRTPTKIFPTTPIIPWVQRLLLRPGKLEELNAWRAEGDEPGFLPPLAEVQAGLEAFDDPKQPLSDISDGLGWRAMSAGMHHEPGGPWKVHDADEYNQRFVALQVPLVFILNIDWYV